MRTSTRVNPTLNHNISDMKAKYDITYMIAAFHYEEVGVNDGRREWEHNRKDFYKTHIEGNVFPSGLLHVMSQDLASMAGWAMGHDNKTAYMVVMGGDVAVLGFYDGRCTLVKWNPFHREEVPHNIYKGRERVQKAYTEWRESYLWAHKLSRRAEQARTFSPIGEKLYGKCEGCGEDAYRRQMGKLMCDDCQIKCQCGSTTQVWTYDSTGEKMCVYCRNDADRRAKSLVCDKCHCGYDGDGDHYQVGDACSNDHCVGRLKLRYPTPTQKARLDAEGTAKGKTQIVAHHIAGECVLPGIGAEDYQLRHLKN